MEIRPFRAYRFNGDVVGDTSDCIAPPYDVISADEQDALYARSEHNIVRIIKGRTAAGDDETNNQYTRAAGYLSDWMQSGAIRQDEVETIYAYVQNFVVAGRQYQRDSFIALAKLEDFGAVVRPHEETLSKPKADRLQLQLATAAKFGLVFLFYEDQKRVADEIIKAAAATGDALIDFEDDQGVRHRLFAIADQGEVEAIAAMMADKSCIIADGHHRYETGLNYLRETGNPAAAHQMMVFVNSHDEGLVVLATHRLVGNLDEFDTQTFLESLAGDFEVSDIRFDDEQGKDAARREMMDTLGGRFEQNDCALGVYCGDGAFYVAVLADRGAMDEYVADKSEAWKSLDVSVLHKLVLEKMLGIGASALAGQLNVDYIKDTASAIDDSIAAVDSGGRQIAFFMNPPKVSQIQMVADAGEKMPQKSTYFYPKMFTGLLINKL